MRPIAWASSTLGARKSRYLTKSSLLYQAVDNDGKNAADQAAVDAQAPEAAAPEVEDFAGVLAIIRPADAVGRRAEDVVETGADDADNQRPRQQFQMWSGFSPALAAVREESQVASTAPPTIKTPYQCSGKRSELEDYWVHRYLSIDGFKGNAKALR